MVLIHHIGTRITKLILKTMVFQSRSAQHFFIPSVEPMRILKELARLWTNVEETYVGDKNSFPNRLIPWTLSQDKEFDILIFPLSQIYV